MDKKKQVLVGFALWLGLALLGLLATNYYEILQYIFFLRIPIIVGLLLALFPTISLKLLPEMLGNLFVLRANNQLAIVISTAVLAGVITTKVFNIILSHASLRFGVSNWGVIPELLEYVIGIALSLPISIAAVKQSQEEIEKGQEGTEKKGVIFGVVAAVLLLIGIKLANNLFESSGFLEFALVKILSIFPEKMQAGYLGENGELSEGIATMSGFSFTTTILYLAGYYVFKPRPTSNRFEAPALFYVTLILSVMVILLGGISFFNDLSRVPVFILLILISAGSYGLFKVDHYYKIYCTKFDKDKKLNTKAWKQAIYRRLENQSENNTLVVVCASGGGIQAAGWTTQVLTGLQKEIGTNFTKSISWISAVSGGAVGTMFYIDGFGSNGYPEDRDLDKIFASATEDSLDATGWGAAYPDLLRFLGLPFAVPKDKKSGTATEEDRGTAIEIDWKGEMKNPHASLDAWYEKVEKGLIPIPIFNATLVEDGRRFLISPMALGDNPECLSIDFNTLYPEYNLDVTTAARLSATFPYISPVCRPSEETKSNFHVGDGGYFDNFGVSTSVELLEELLDSDNQQKISKVLFLQINAFPEDGVKNENKGAPGWQMEVVGSLFALLNVRNRTQTAANKLQVKLLAQKHKCGYQNDDNELKLQFLKDKCCQKGVAITDVQVTFPPKFQQPLSWQLTQKQKEAIAEGWNQIKGDIVDKIKNFLDA